MSDQMKHEEVVQAISQARKRFRHLHRRVRDQNRPHFFNDESKNPKLEEPLEQVAFQSDVLRQVHSRLKSRLTENHFTVRSNPLTTAGNAISDDYEEVMNTGLMLVEERNGYTLQGGLADGQIIDGYAVLHWYLLRDLWPRVPDYEWLDEQPDGDQKARFEEDPTEHKGKQRFRERPESVRSRDKAAKAKAGFPWHVEVPDMTTVYPVWDTLGLAMVSHIRTIGLIDYENQLNKGREQDEKVKLRLSGDRNLRMYREKDAPTGDDPSKPDYGQTVTIATLWTRDHWYETACWGEPPDAETLDLEHWEEIKDDSHAYGRPPFAFVPGKLITSSQDPLYRYQPALEGLYRLKPHVDRSIAMMMGLSERIVLADLYVVRDPNGDLLTEDGEPKHFSRNAADAMVLDGYTLEKLEFNINDAFVQATSLIMEQFEGASPSTGQAELAASTQPWTARLALEQASVEPKELLNLQIDALRDMVRSMTRVNALPAELGGLGHPLWTFKKETEKGQTKAIIGVEPEELESLWVDIDINPVSSSHQTTLTEHGASLLERGRITERDFTENFMGKPNAAQYLSKLDAEKLWKTFILPARGRQAVARLQGASLFVGPDGSVIGLDGQPMPPEDVLGASGIRPADAGAFGANPGANPAAGSIGNQQTMQPLTDNSPPSGAPPMGPLQ